ncbi:MAG TPA: cyclic nucleotide-binding domain-containing protein [Streptosporangiaceae bacterium]|nr:cyclic nucleotide-binding domain-containing protein [Streptosporangiaceae bacterium]
MTLEPLLRGHRFFAGLAPEYLALINGCARNTVFDEGTFMFREGEQADEFYLIRDGRLALEIHGPGRGPVVVQTLRAGDVAGFSWLIDTHRWQFDGRVIEPVRAIGVDGRCLRDKCEQDPKLGFELMRRFAGLAVDRLQATRLQLLDVYGHAHG